MATVSCSSKVCGFGLWVLFGLDPIGPFFSGEGRC